MIKKDLAFFIFIIFSVIVLAVNIALLAVCGIAIMKMSTYIILTLNPYRAYAISLIAVDGFYLFVLVLYLLLRKRR